MVVRLGVLYKKPWLEGWGVEKVVVVRLGEKKLWS